MAPLSGPSPKKRSSHQVMGFLAERASQRAEDAFQRFFQRTRTSLSNTEPGASSSLFQTEPVTSGSPRDNHDDFHDSRDDLAVHELPAPPSPPKPTQQSQKRRRTRTRAAADKRANEYANWKEQLPHLINSYETYLSDTDGGTLDPPPHSDERCECETQREWRKVVCLFWNRM